VVAYLCQSIKVKLCDDGKEVGSLHQRMLFRHMGGAAVCSSTGVQVSTKVSMYTDTMLSQTTEEYVQGVFCNPVTLGVGTWRRPG
jgi:hypothetical protein